MRVGLEKKSGLEMEMSIQVVDEVKGKGKITQRPLVKQEEMKAKNRALGNTTI